MRLFATIICFLVIGLFWWITMKRSGKNVGRIVSRIGSARGSMRRRALRDIANLSPITAIQKPLIAAATIMVSIQSEEFVLGDGDEEILEILLARLAGEQEIEEAMKYAKWAILQVTDSNAVVDKLGGFLKLQLDNNEKIQFLGLLDEANAKIGGCYDFAASKLRLANMMGIEVLN